jgi:hypothetical protein
MSTEQTVNRILDNELQHLLHTWEKQMAKVATVRLDGAIKVKVIQQMTLIQGDITRKLIETRKENT